MLSTLDAGPITSAYPIWNRCLFARSAAFGAPMFGRYLNHRAWVRTHKKERRICGAGLRLVKPLIIAETVAGPNMAREMLAFIASRASLRRQITALSRSSAFVAPDQRDNRRNLLRRVRLG
jgi:hypothetical protein